MRLQWGNTKWNESASVACEKSRDKVVKVQTSTIKAHKETK
jgi:hypothetical protein